MKIKVGYLEYDFEIVDRMPEGYDDANGVILYTKKRLYVRNDSSWDIDYLNYVVYHEIAHGMLEQMGAENSEVNATRFGHKLYETFGDYRKFLID